MTLHKEIQAVHAAVKELLEVADAISGMRRRGDGDDDSHYSTYPIPLLADRHCGDLLDDVVAPLPSGKRYAPEPKLFKWEQAVSSDERRVVKLLFTDYKAKKAALAALLSREVGTVSVEAMK